MFPCRSDPERHMAITLSYTGVLYVKLFLPFNLFVLITTCLSLNFNKVYRTLIIFSCFIQHPSIRFIYWMIYSYDFPPCGMSRRVSSSLIARVVHIMLTIMLKNCYYYAQKVPLLCSKFSPRITHFLPPFWKLEYK